MSAAVKEMVDRYECLKERLREEINERGAKLEVINSLVIELRNLDDAVTREFAQGQPSSNDDATF